MGLPTIEIQLLWHRDGDGSIAAQERHRSTADQRLATNRHLVAPLSVLPLLFYMA
jgi:hypothetical protein